MIKGGPRESKVRWVVAKGFCSGPTGLEAGRDRTEELDQEMKERSERKAKVIG